MANWTGTYTIASGLTGTSTGGNGASTFNNVGVTWPTSGTGLANFTLKITGGLGAGQERIVLSNTTTQITTTAPWGTVPDATSTYEIILRFYNGDHVTGNIVLGVLIVEVADSTTVYVDGLYTITTLNVLTSIRMAKTWATMATFEANNRTVQGKVSFWSYFYLNVTLTTPPLIQYVRFRDASQLMMITGDNDVSGVHHLVGENCAGALAWYSSGTLTTSHILRNILARKSALITLYFSGASSLFDQVYEQCWVDSSQSSTVIWLGNGPARQVIRESVIINGFGGYVSIVDASKSHTVRDCCIKSPTDGYGSGVLVGAPTSLHVGEHQITGNVLKGTRFLFAAAAIAAPGSGKSSFNDICPDVPCPSYWAFDIGSAGSYVTATSDNDFIAGQGNAAPENIDTTEATTSTANPSQYRNLSTARTNAKAVRNRPLNVDNIVAGTPGPTSLAVTFDCQNGAVAGQGSSSVNADSIAGQPTLNIANTTGFETGGVLEIGYGTARFETARVLSITPGISITFETNLVFTHTATQADTVKKSLRNWSLPLIRYGIVSGILNMSTDLPKREDWGFIWTGINKTWNGREWNWLQRGHSVTMQGLKPSTTYYYKIFCINPLGEEFTDDVEWSFTTAADPNYSDPGVSNVRQASTYQFNSPTPNRTGLLDLPAVGNVRAGTTFDGATKTGLLDLPAIVDVKIGVQFDQTTKTGTYDGTDRHSDPGEANVRLGTAYKANSPTNNKTGTLDLPVVGNVRAGVTFDGITKIGLLDLPAEAAVKVGVQFDQTTKTGLYEGLDRYSDPGVVNVRTAISYKFNTTGGDNRTGTLDLSAEYTDPGIVNVRDGVQYKYGAPVINREGTLDLPAEANVRDGVFFDNLTQEGSLLSVDPGVANVTIGVPYAINSVLKVGTLSLPFTPGQVADAVWDEMQVDHPISGTMGQLMNYLRLVGGEGTVAQLDDDDLVFGILDDDDITYGLLKGET